MRLVSRENKPRMPARPDASFVTWFRSVAPYFHAFRGRTFVIAFGGELVAEGRFVTLAHDLNLLHSAGIRVVLVHGSRPQIEAQLRARRKRSRYHKGLRVTDPVALECVKAAVGLLRVEMGALLSLGLPNTPMAGAAINTVSGNFISAQPMGVHDGIDYQHTGTVRKVDAQAIAGCLDAGNIVIVSPIGFSPTGEVFNLAMEDVAVATAAALRAAKLVFFSDAALADSGGRLLPELSANEAERLLAGSAHLTGDTRAYLAHAVEAVRAGVERAHVVARNVDGALLAELFTHEGSGSMITADKLERLRPATIDDVGGILQLIEPLEADGTLVRRGRELLEREIDRFTVLEHDRLILGCAALYPFPRARAGELACLAVRPDYRRTGHGEKLMAAIESRARAKGMKKLFVLTTRTAQWFVERGFAGATAEALPREKRSLYNWQRRSKVLVKPL
jgi:amino-acid N-acetyltransferase